MSETTTKKACFRVDGRWLADFARTRYEEGVWERALKLLIDSLDGLTSDQAIAILKGEADLRGDSSDPKGISIRKTPKTSLLRKRMSAITERMYGQIFRYGDAYWTPYARVTGPWNNEDYKFSRSDARMTPHILGTGRTGMKDSRDYYRSMYYADDPAMDMLVIFNEGIEHYEVLCKKTAKMPPFWVHVSTNEPEQFLRKLAEFGELKSSWDFDYRGAYEDPLPKNPAPPELIVDTPSKEDRQDETRAQVQKFIDAISNAKDEKELAEAEDAFEAHMNKTRQGDVPAGEWDRIEEGRTKARLNTVALYRARILKQAEEHGGMYRLELKNKDDTPYSPRFVEVPKNALINWALRGFRFEDFGKEQPHWEPVTHSGMKMAGDDPYHTDMIIGGGADPWETYDRGFTKEDKKLPFGAALNNACWAVKSKIAEEWTGVEFTFLAKSDDIYMSGTVVHAKRGEPVPAGSIAICEDASVDYQAVLESISNGDKRGAIICETGGKLAHLATVGREYNVMVLMVPDALKKYREGRLIFIDLKKMEITMNL